MKNLVVGTITAMLLLTGVIGIAYAHHYNPDQCNSNNEENCPEPSVICDNGEHTGNPHCIKDTPTTFPTINPCQIDSVAEFGDEDEKDDCLTPTDTPEASPSATPTVEPTVEIRETPQTGGDGGHQSDGRNDGLGCAAHPCTDAHGEVLSSEVGWK